MALREIHLTSGDMPFQGLHPGKRVDGWKEVAAYLGRGERTVKRWEVDRGLPVHRLPGTGRGSVHAYQGELDAWLASSRFREAETADPGPTDPQSHRSESAGSHLLPDPVSAQPWWAVNRRFTFFLLVATTLTIAGLSSWFAYRVRAENATPGLKAAASFTPERSVSHDFYLTGRFEWNKRTPDSLRMALSDFTQSIVHDPNNAAAYSGLADTYVVLSAYSLMNDREGFTKALAAATKAVELDDSLAEAHRSLGFAEIWGNWDFRDGERELRRAIQLNPHDPLTHLWYATAFKSPEWYPITSQEFKLAQELDPTSTAIVANKSIWLFENGDTRGGLDLAHRAERADPDFIAPHFYLALMHWYQHDYPDFFAENRKIAEIQHNESLRTSTNAETAAYHTGGEDGLLRYLYSSRKALYEQGKLSGGYLAEVSIRLGKTDETFDLLRDDYAHHRSEFLWIFTRPDMRALQGDSRYQDLLKLIDYPKPPAAIAGIQ